MIESEIKSDILLEKFLSIYSDYSHIPKLTPFLIDEIVCVTSHVLNVEDSDILNKKDIKFFCKDILEPFLFDNYNHSSKIKNINLCNM